MEYENNLRDSQGHQGQTIICPDCGSSGIPQGRCFYCPCCGYPFTQEMIQLAQFRNQVYCEYCGNGLEMHPTHRTRKLNSPNVY